MRSYYVVMPLCCLLFACAGSHRDDDTLTIRDLQKDAEIVEVKPSEIEITDRKAIEQNYRDFINQSKESDLRAQAMRRLADLALSSGD